MKKNLFVRLCAVFLATFYSCTYTNKENSKVIEDSKQAIVSFYNVENLFDTIDNPNSNDNEFLPSGKKEWDYYKYMNKSKRIAQTFRAIGGVSFPQIIGLAEIENRIVLQDLLVRPSFQKRNYGIIHQESPDPRGIDVALLYAKSHFTYVHSEFIAVNSTQHHVRSRDILYAALSAEKDTFHVYVNHWSSRRGGVLKSDPKRMYASSLLSKHLDSIQLMYHDANIIIMGDFNDDPWSPSLKKMIDNDITNLSSSLEQCGTTYYRKEWYCFDQMLISKNLVDLNLPYASEMEVANLDFLSKMTSDGTKVPNRTYQGNMYINGFSDHYPVYLRLYH